MHNNKEQAYSNLVARVKQSYPSVQEPDKEDSHQSIYSNKVAHFWETVNQKYKNFENHTIFKLSAIDE